MGQINPRKIITALRVLTHNKLAMWNQLKDKNISDKSSVPERLLAFTHIHHFSSIDKNNEIV